MVSGPESGGVLKSQRLISEQELSEIEAEARADQASRGVQDAAIDRSVPSGTILLLIAELRRVRGLFSEDDVQRLSSEADSPLGGGHRKRTMRDLAKRIRTVLH